MADAALGVKRASAALGTTIPPRECLLYVRTWLGAPGGPPTAAAAWLSARGKHMGDPSPPPGVPVFFAPNHVALSVGDGGIISTDWPRPGTVGLTTISELSNAWHHPYLGWTDTIDGAPIRGIGGAKAQLAVTNAGFHIPSIPFPLNPFGQPPSIPGNPLGGIGSALGSLGSIAGLLTNPFTYIRLAMFGAGAVLLFLALHKFDSVQTATSGLKDAAVSAAMKG